MPELPEVETVVRDLRGPLVGRRIRSVTTSPHPLRRKWDQSWETQLVGARVCEVRRRGKWIIVALDRGRFLVFHLGMSGQITVTTSTHPAANHTHLVFALDRGKEQLRFRDIRRFGSATLFKDEQALGDFFDECKLGPEPFDLDAAYWRARLAGARRSLKAVLLDQRVVAGVGNIYADESLFEAKLHPATLACALNRTAAERLRNAIATVLDRAIHLRGSTIRNYVGGSGLKGGYQDQFRVYGRTGERCPRCRTPIERVRLAGRSTHYCPKCQRR